MIRAKRLCRIAISTLLASSVGLAIAAPAPALAGPAYIKLGGVEGESSEKGHEGEIEILSWSWGASNSAGHGTGGSMGAGKVVVNDVILPTTGPARDHGHASDASAGKAAPPAAVSHDLRTNVVARKSIGKPKIGEATTDLAASGGSGVASPRDSASGLATGKRQHKPHMHSAPMGDQAATLAAPPAQGSVRVTSRSPWLACRVGARYPELRLGADGRVYRMSDVTVSSCGGGSAQAAESISFSYAKIQF